MRKKILLSILSTLTLFFLFFGNGLVFAQDMVQTINYDEATRTLTIKTNPDADIFLSNLAGRYFADSEGNFSIVVPEGVDRETIMINDYLTNESTEFDFDFSKKTIASDPVATSSSADTTSQTTTSSKGKTQNSTDETDAGEISNATKTNNSANQTENKTQSPETTKENNAFYFWGLLIILALAIGTVIFLIVKNKKG